MVAINSSRLAVVFSLCSLVLLPVGVDAAALQSRRSTMPAKQVASGKGPVREDSPVLPLPLAMRKNKKGKSKAKGDDNDDASGHKHHDKHTPGSHEHPGKSKDTRASRWELWQRRTQQPFALESRKTLTRRDHERYDDDDHSDHWHRHHGYYDHDRDDHRHHHHHSHSYYDRHDRRHHDDRHSEHEHVHENIHEHVHEHYHGHEDDSHHRHHSRGDIVIANGSNEPFVLTRERSVAAHRKRYSRLLAMSKREDSVPGIVDIMSPDDRGAKRLASLFLDSSTTPYTLNAGEKNKTMLYLASAPATRIENTTDTPVNLKLVLNDMATQRRVWYCATFDPSPSTPEPLTVEPCFTGEVADQPHKSQVFAYNSGSGIVRPLWYKDANNGTQIHPQASLNATSDDSDAIVLSTRENTVPQNGTSVTMVFVPHGETAAAAGLDVEQPSSPTSTTSMDLPTPPTPSASWFSAVSPVASAGAPLIPPIMSDSAPAISAMATPSAMNQNTEGDSMVNGLEVQVAAVTSSAPPCSSSHAVSAMSAMPSPTINAADAAASIISAAADQATPLSPPGALATPYEMANPYEAVPPPSLEAMAAPSLAGRHQPAPMMTAVETEPYMWKFMKRNGA